MVFLMQARTTQHRHQAEPTVTPTTTTMKPELTPSHKPLSKFQQPSQNKQRTMACNIELVSPDKKNNNNVEIVLQVKVEKGGKSKNYGI